MNIKHFKEKFVDWIDESNEIGLPSTIQVQDGGGFGNRWWGVVTNCEIVGDTAILSVGDYTPTSEYEFTDKTIFDSVSKIVFGIEGKIIEDAKWVDTSWGDRTFVFEVGGIKHEKDNRNENR